MNRNPEAQPQNTTPCPQCGTKLAFESGTCSECNLALPEGWYDAATQHQRSAEATVLKHIQEEPGSVGGDAAKTVEENRFKSE